MGYFATTLINKALYKGYHHLKFGADLSDQTATGELNDFF
ncbi:hypothetical protein ATG98_3038 [Marinobacter sp. LV10R520-4]|nr:hypothetical protein ATG98_3038 [Marinobacter sp. LV10R520-4]